MRFVPTTSEDSSVSSPRRAAHGDVSTINRECCAGGPRRRRRVTVQLSASLVVDGDESSQQFVMQVQDISERKRLEEQLQRVSGAATR